jgi:ketosteroid isomerase-like protein
MDPEYTGKLLNTMTTAATAGLSDHQAILHKVYSAMVEGDFDALGESMTDDVELNICGFGPCSGTWRGRSEVAAATRNNLGLLDSQQPEIENTLRQGDSTVVMLREKGVFKSTGQAYSIRAVQWFTFVGGKISKIDELVAEL